MCSCSGRKGYGKSYGCECGDCNRGCDYGCKKGCGCGKKKHNDCCCDDCCERVESVQSLCVTCRLQVNGATKLKGTTQVDKLCFSDKSSPKDCKKWCVQELGSSMLGFQYQGAPQVRMTKTGLVLESLETLSVSGGATGVDPDVEKATTVVCITGNTDNVTGTLADGKYTGQIKYIAVAKTTVGFQYHLTVSNLAPTPGPVELRLGLNDPAAAGSSGVSLLWHEDRWIPLSDIQALLD